MNYSKNKESTVANTGLSQSPKPDNSSAPRPLTPQEIESLRQDRKDSAKHSREYFLKHVQP